MRLTIALLLILSVLLTPTISHAEENKWEVSLGTTQMFIGGYKEGSIPVPTNSATFILSRKVYESFALWAVFNLPTSSNKRFTEEGFIEETQTPPSLMLGASYELLSYDLTDNKYLGLDVGASVGHTITLDGQFFPVGAFRLKFVKDKDSTMYAGVTTSPYTPEGDLVLGLIYGMGYRF
jgi:hypothetical protein